MARRQDLCCRLALPSLFLTLAWCSCTRTERHFVFRYTLAVRDLPRSADQVDVWLPVPPDTCHQQIVSLTFFSPVEGELTSETRYGNRMWHARTSPPADGTWRITQQVEVVRREQEAGSTGDGPVHLDAASLRRFLEPNRLVPLNERFAKIAREQARGQPDPLARARALYDYVIRRMSYDKSEEGWGRGDATYACDAGKGNCSDFHSLFIALGRSAGIPARFWCGFPLPDRRGQGTITGYHCWAEFWAPGAGWVPVDISEADKHPDKTEYFFGNLDENRIVYTLGRDLILTPGQQGPPINFFIYPYVEVDGVPWDRVEHRFTYEDLP